MRYTVTLELTTTISKEVLAITLQQLAHSHQLASIITDITGGGMNIDGLNVQQITEPM